MNTNRPYDLQELEALLNPPSPTLDPPPHQLDLPPLQHSLLTRLQEEHPPDPYKRYQLALRAEPVRQENLLHYLLCLSQFQHEETCEHLLRTTREVISRLHGRALLAHEPGLYGPLGLTLLVQEHLKRGLVHRILFLTSSPLIPFWASLLNTHLPEPFETSPQLPSTPEPPPRLILPLECFAEELPEAFLQNTPYQMIVVSPAESLHQRRSPIWRNLLSLSPPKMLLSCNFPFQEQPIELHGYLALLGVPELPPPARLKRELGPPEQPITPETRQTLRPFLKASVVRNTHPTTTLVPAPCQWKPYLFLPHAPTQRLRKQIQQWIGKLYPAQDGEGSSEEQATPSNVLFSPLLDLLRATESNTHTTAYKLDKLARDPLFAEHQSLLLEWKQEAEKLAPQDPRINTLHQLLREYPNARALIFCHHHETLQLLEEALAIHTRPRISLRTPAAPPIDQPALFLACDEQLPTTLQGPFDLLIHFDLPWQPEILDARSYWLLHQQNQHNRTIFCILPETSPDAQLFETLDFRLKLNEILPEELPILMQLLPQEWQFPQTRLKLLHTPPTAFFEQLSKLLIEARKRYRQVRDLQQRLFLDDYTK